MTKTANHRHSFIGVGILTFVTFNSLISIGQTQPSTTTKAANVAKSPLEVASTYLQSLLDEDGAQLLASVDTRDKDVLRIMTSRAAEIDANRRYRMTVKKKFDVVADQSAQPANAAMLQAVLKGMAAASVSVKGDRATVIPSLPNDKDNPTGGDWGPLFQVELAKVENVWRIRIQECGELIKLQVDAASTAQAEMALAYAKEKDMIATQIEEGRFKNYEEASSALQQRWQAAQLMITQRWKTEKAKNETKKP